MINQASSIVFRSFYLKREQRETNQEKSKAIGRKKAQKAQKIGSSDFDVSKLFVCPGFSLLYCRIA
jgi:hypothetical protein